MADNFLEKHFEDYEARKAAYLRKKKHLPPIKHHLPERPEDDAALVVHRRPTRFAPDGVRRPHRDHAARFPLRRTVGGRLDRAVVAV